MAKTPAISVIVPVYKVELYIKQCIDSILKQTFQDFEIIFVDDASPDNSFELCYKLYGGNDKFKFIRHEKNSGLGAARNSGMKYSTGKYIYFVDSDDFILPNALETFYNVAEKNNAQVVHAAGWHELWQDEAEPVLQENVKHVWNKYNQEGFLPYDVVYRLEEHWKNYITWSMAWLSFCRRDFLEQNKIEFLDIISEDETFNFALFCLAERYYILHEALYMYRRRTGSIMMSNNLEKFSKSIRSIVVGSIYVKKFLERIPSDEQWREGIMNAFFNRFLVTHTAFYYRDLDSNSTKNAVVEKALAPFFTDGEPFVRFFFNGFNFYRRRSEVLSQQNQQLNYITDLLIREQPAILELMTSIKSGGRRVFLMGTPTHGNLGDQAIALSEFLLLKEYLPHYKIVEIPYMYLTDQLGEILWGLGFEKFLRKSDVIFLLGGGNLGNLWINEEQLRRKLIEKFPENKIVIFPQSIYFSADEDGRRELATSQDIYNGHKNLHLILRDENSFELAQKIFPEVKRYLLPDTATVLHGITDAVDVKREGVLFILRQDKERVRDDAKIQILQDGFTKHNIPFEFIDTVINEKVTAENREQKVRDVLLKIRKSKLVITDRFHGVIFSFITRTPVLAFKSFDTKISSGIKWFKDLPSIFYAEEQDWAGIENFVNKALFDEGTFTELNSSVKFDSKKVFFHTLDEIIRPNEFELVNLFNPPPPRLRDKVDNKETRRLIVDAINISERRIVFKYRIQGDWKKCFNANAEFFIEYSEDISKTPDDIAVIPFLCNVLPIAWVLDAEIVVETLDYDFYAHLSEVKQGYINMYPRIKFGGKLTVNRLVSHDYETSDETAALFSGGADSFDTLIAHAAEHPTLVTLLGSDLKLNDNIGWERVSKHALETAKQFQCKNLFIASSFRLFLNEGFLHNLVMPLANDGWWHGFQSGIGIIGHIAPYAYLHKLKKLYIASSFDYECKNYTCASDPTIDNYVYIGKCATIHDGFEFSRQNKIRRICKFARQTGEPVLLRVCWISSGGQNCCACEKCYRTICGILAEGENPAKFGFPSYSLDNLKRNLQNLDFVPEVNRVYWRAIQERFREKPKNLAKAKNLNWLMEVKFS